MNATEIAAALSTRAEDVCRRYLPRGRKQGRYWTAGDTSGAKGRSLHLENTLMSARGSLDDVVIAIMDANDAIL